MSRNFSTARIKDHFPKNRGNWRNKFVTTLNKPPKGHAEDQPRTLVGIKLMTTPTKKAFFNRLKAKLQIRRTDKYALLRRSTDGSWFVVVYSLHDTEKGNTWLRITNRDMITEINILLRQDPAAKYKYPWLK